MQVKIDRKALKAVALFQAVQDIRYYLNGVFVEFNPMQTRLVATDGNTLAAHKSDAKDENIGASSFIIPSETVKQILAWKLPAKYSDDFLTIKLPEEFGSKNFECRAEYYGMTAVFVPIDGTFPNYRRVIPQQASGEITHLNPAYIARCDKAVEIIKDNKKTMAHVTIAHNGENAVLVTYGGLPNLCMVVMPMRLTAPGINDFQWARQDLPEVPAETAAEASETVAA